MTEKLLLAVILSVLAVGYGVTDPGDAAIINAFRDGLENPQVLKWPAKGNDPCGPPSWNGVFCQNGRVQQIQAKDLNLKGTLPKNLNQLTMLENIGLQRNQFTGQIPSLSGLKNLKFAYLDYNEFDSIPGDFLRGLDSLQVVALDNNNFNASTGWMFSEDILGSPQLVNVSCMRCNLAGDLPDFLGKLVSLTVLRLSGNRITGPIPSSFDGLSLQIFWLNDQSGGGMTGPIDTFATMPSLVSLWLHGNQFSGSIPEKIVNLTFLKDFDVNGNKLVGFVPFGMANMSLDHLDLNNNMLMGPTPKFKAPKASYEMNDFCLPTPGVHCAPEVMALLDFLSWLNYPPRLVSSWSGNDPCHSWLGVSCYDDKVTVINLPNFGLTGELCPSIGRLDGLTQIRLANNHLSGQIPESWTNLKYLQLLDLRNNSISSPVPKFGSSVKLMLGGNPTNNSTHGSSSSSVNNSSPDVDSILGNPSSMPFSQSSSTASSIIKGVVIPTASAIVVAALLLAILLILYTRKNRAKSESQPSHLINQKNSSDPDKMVKISVANNVIDAPSILTGSGSASRSSNGGVDYHYGEERNLIISIHVLREVTNNFAPEKELGHGGFGVVYLGELDDGTKIAVKRMEAGIVNSKALDEFQSEIAVLSNVRHRNLVSLLGYCTEGNERILVYEYVSQGALSKHLFHWKDLNLDPVSWKRRLYMALDVARGLEYLHNLTHQSFIHRDLKSSNILLGDDFRAKISDFGLVKLAPDGERSLATRLAGTFGYLAPEYAVTGKITTKVDVYSFGVVLMELLTGLVVIDESRSEEKRYLASWFWSIKSNKEKLRAAIDPALELNEDTLESISVIAELAGHCTAREPWQRPDMGYCVNILSPLVEKWIPLGDDTDECCGIDYSLPLNQLVQDWQESEGKDLLCAGLENSKNSLPGRPDGFAESFTSVDAR